MNNKKEKLGQEPAFPMEYTSSTKGMSKRLLIAKDILCARIGRGDHDDTELIVSNSYKIADELLKQENE